MLASSGANVQPINPIVFIDSFRVPAWGCRRLLRLLGVTFEVRGVENIQHKSGGVVVINHQSAVDLGSKLFFSIVKFTRNTMEHVN